jgi:hypothetical protein
MYLYMVMMFAASLLYNIFDVWNAKIVVKRGVSYIPWRICHRSKHFGLAPL